MEIVIKRESGESCEFTCSDFDMDLEQNKYKKITFHNPSKNLPYWFKASNIVLFDDDGKVITFTCR